MKQSAYDRDGTAFAKGKRGEEFFFELATKLGLNPQHVSEQMDRNDHIDCVITSRVDGTQKTVDIKGSKKYTEDQLFLVELFNVNGDLGWLFGKADYIAFQYKHAFLVVDRKELVKLICETAHITVKKDLYHEGEVIVTIDPAYLTQERPAVAPHHFRRDTRPDECVTYITGTKLKPIIGAVLK